MNNSNQFIADLHIHSYFSRATSPNSNLEYYSQWAKLKGIKLLSTGDFTHPKWFRELKEKLVEVNPGIYKLKEEPKISLLEGIVPKSNPVYFILNVEISSIYKKKDKIRKVHNLIFVPNIEIASKINTSLSKIGNIESDGRPILGLDSKKLLEIVLDASTDAFMIPAHIWTPWFSVMGSKSGFDSIEECFEDLSPYIFALETGLSSDPSMNWRLSKLDRFTLVSNSDAHSPNKLGREANLFDVEMNYYKIKESLITKKGFNGTIEFFPEEGKYHFDGHRKCNVRLDPEETLKLKEICPVCGKKVTIGVMNRVEILADRDRNYKPTNVSPFKSMIPLNEILGEVYNTGSDSKSVWRIYSDLINKFETEFDLLLNVPIDEIKNNFGTLISEAINRVRSGKVNLLPGFDGEYGKISIFEPGEKENLMGQTLLFDYPKPRKIKKYKGISNINEKKDKNSSLKNVNEKNTDQIQILNLNDQQQKAIDYNLGHLIITAGPGTGKTRTLVQKIIKLIKDDKVNPEQILVVTFTNKAGLEIKERLKSIFPSLKKNFSRIETKEFDTHIPIIGTFHSFGLSILKELNQDIMVISEIQKQEILSEIINLDKETRLKSISEKISKWKSSFLYPEDIENHEEKIIYQKYQKQLIQINAYDYDDLIIKPVQLFEENPEILKIYKNRFKYILIDEYQDINYAQYRLINLLVSSNSSLFVIGDPDQAIYGFRGSDYSYFLRFTKDYNNALSLKLEKNYRSCEIILKAASNVIKNNINRENINLKSTILEEGKISHTILPNDKFEAEFIIQTIESFVGGTSHFSMDTGRSDGLSEGISFSDIAVLYRLHLQQEELKIVFDRAGIPFQLVGEKTYFNKKGFKEVISYLKLVMFSQDWLSLKEILNVPNRNLDKEVCNSIINEIRNGKSIEYFIKNSVLPLSQRERIEELNNKIIYIKEMIKNNTLENVILDLFDYINISVNQEEKNKFIEFVSGFNNNLETMLDYIFLHLITTEYDSDSEKVSIMSIHASKGLEFPVVFIVGCEEGLIPCNIFNDMDIEEERRLFYVGMTRAKKELILTSTSRRLIYGKVIENKPSRFIEEIGFSLPQKKKVEKYKKKKKVLQLSLFDV